MSREGTRKLPIVINILCVMAITGCGSQLYKVRPLPASRPPEITSSNDRGLNFGAAVLGGDRAMEQFEANLPLAGVIAVDVKLVNQSSESINATRLRFDVRSADLLREILPKKALSKVINFYGNSFYRVDARRRTQESYDAIALNLKGRIEPGEARRGFLFFEAPDKVEEKQVTALTLTVSGFGAPISIDLEEETGENTKQTNQTKQKRKYETNEK